MADTNWKIEEYVEGCVVAEPINIPQSRNVVDDLLPLIKESYKLLNARNIVLSDQITNLSRYIILMIVLFVAIYIFLIIAIINMTDK